MGIEKESCINGKRQCFYCGTEQNLHRHHCIHGTANRRLAEEDGLWIYLCPKHHEYVHSAEGRANDIRLHGIAEEAWMKRNRKGIPEFIERYGKNWL